MNILLNNHVNVLHIMLNSDEFDEDQEPAVVAKTIQKLALDIVGRISATETQSSLVHDFRSLLRLGRSNFVW